MLISYPHQILATRAFEVDRVDDSVRTMIGQLHAVRANCAIVGAEAVALAGPQVGFPLRMFVWVDESGDHEILNPVIVERSGSQSDYESCLSLLGPFDEFRGVWRAGISVQVTRAERVLMRGLNAEGVGIELEAEGFVARILQHELDHLDGKVILDRVTKQVRKQALRRWEQAKRRQPDDNEALEKALRQTTERLAQRSVGL